MRLRDIKDCKKCSSAIMYGDTLKCNSLNVDCRRKFNEEGRYYASECKEYSVGNTQRAGLIEQKHCLRFILAGKSEFILHSTKTGDNFRFKLTKEISKDDNSKSIYFINQINTNESIYAGILVFNEEINEYEFKQGKNGKLSSLDISIRSLIFVINKLNKGDEVSNLELYHLGKCGCCGEKIMSLGNEETGLCKICLKR